MKATFTKNDYFGAYNYGGDKEMITECTVVAYHKGDFRIPVTVRWYMGRSKSATAVYCSIWLGRHAAPGKPRINTSGSGMAAGYGYHKVSAALASALDDAGVQLWGSPYGHPINGETKENYRKRADIGGCGDGSIRAALEAITQALGYRKFTIVGHA